MNKKITYFYIIAIFISLALISTKAIAAPTPQMVKEVIDYYYNGQKSGPILMEAKLCRSIEDNECIEEINTKAVPIGEATKVWMKFLVPREASYDDIFVEYKYQGVPRQLSPYKVEGSIRYRVISTFRPNKVGEWTIIIKRGNNDLKEFSINVVEK
ncbi:MAG: hypothetical protein ACMUJM_19295 [bacterium]